MNKGDYDWSIGFCAPGSTAHYVEGILTHERGHTWAVLNFLGDHPNQTMGQAASHCPGLDAKQTLGLGDMISLEYWY